MVSYLSAKKAGYRKCALVLTKNEKKRLNLKSHKKDRDQSFIKFCFLISEKYFISIWQNRNINTLGKDHERKEMKLISKFIFFFTEMCQFNESNSFLEFLFLM